jgi:hypothetical protein
MSHHQGGSSTADKSAALSQGGVVGPEQETTSRSTAISAGTYTTFFTDISSSGATSTSAST